MDAIALTAVGVTLAAAAGFVMWNRRRRRNAKRDLEDAASERERNRVQAPQEDTECRTWQTIAQTWIGKVMVNNNDPSGIHIPFCVVNVTVYRAAQRRIMVAILCRGGEQKVIELTKDTDVVIYVATPESLAEINRPASQFSPFHLLDRLKELQDIKLIGLDEAGKPFMFAMREFTTQYVRLEYLSGVLQGHAFINSLNKPLPTVVEILPR